MSLKGNLLQILYEIQNIFLSISVVTDNKCMRGKKYPKQYAACHGSMKNYYQLLSNSNASLGYQYSYIKILQCVPIIICVCSLFFCYEFILFDWQHTIIFSESYRRYLAHGFTSFVRTHVRTCVSVFVFLFFCLNDQAYNYNRGISMCHHTSCIMHHA